MAQFHILYFQLARAYFALLEVLCHNHTSVIVTLETSTFTHIVGSLEAGLKCLDVSISTQVSVALTWLYWKIFHFDFQVLYKSIYVHFQCAAAVDNLAAFYFNNITSGENPTSPAAVKMARHITDCPTLFPEVRFMRLGTPRFACLEKFVCCRLYLFY